LVIPKQLLAVRHTLLGKQVIVEDEMIKLCTVFERRMGDAFANGRLAVAFTVAVTTPKQNRLETSSRIVRVDLLLAALSPR
jgi:hypothetical protein